MGSYSGILQNGFVNYDDDKYITENDFVKSGITRDSLIWAFSTGHASNWHPVTWVSHMLDSELYGLKASGHHSTSLLLHISSAVLLLYCLVRMTGALWPSLGVAVLFGIHPLHVESVAWASERKDVLSTFFGLLALVAYLRYVEKRSIVRYAVVIVMFSLGLMAKPMLVTLPFLFLLLDYWPLGRIRFSPRQNNDGKRPYRDWKPQLYRIVREKIPLFILVIASSVITTIVQKRGGAMGTLDAIPLLYRIENALISYVSYLTKALIPKDLSCFYPYISRSVTTSELIASATVLVALTFISVRAIKRAPYFFVGWCWYLGTLVPVIGLVQVGEQSMADRYTYIPMIGIYIIVSWLVYDFTDRLGSRRFVLKVIAAVVCLTLVFATRNQVTVWRNTEALFLNAIRTTKNNYVAHNNLGNYYKFAGNTEKSDYHYRKAIQSNSEYEKAHHNLALSLHAAGDLENAVKHYEYALGINPRYVMVHHKLGVAYAQLGVPDRAEHHYREALSLDPANAEVHDNFGLLLEGQERPMEALEHYQSALSVNPGYNLSNYHLGLLYQKQNKIDDAIRYYSNAIKLNPGYAQARNNLGAAFLQQGKYDLAVEQLEIALRLDPTNTKAQANLDEAQRRQNDEK